MTEEHLMRITEAFFNQERRGMGWEPMAKSTREQWIRMVRAVVIELDKGTPLEEVNRVGWTNYNDNPNYRTGEWDRCVEFTIAEYLLTPRDKP